MNRLWAVAAVLIALNVVLFAQVRHKPVKKKSPPVAAVKGPRRPASRSEAEQRKKTTRTGKVAVRRVMVRRMVHGRWVMVSRAVRVKTGPVIPPHPEPERLREIQQAMADKGFFKGDVNGIWNADSVDALKQFQTSRNLTPDGKITALSLIGLGLGPKHENTVAALPSPVVPQQNNPQ